jgi:hypothetical protein
MTTKKQCSGIAKELYHCFLLAGTGDGAACINI